jgi:hypothetical protein
MESLKKFSPDGFSKALSYAPFRNKSQCKKQAEVRRRQILQSFGIGAGYTFPYLAAKYGHRAEEALYRNQNHSNGGE